MGLSPKHPMSAGLLLRPESTHSSLQCGKQEQCDAEDAVDERGVVRGEDGGNEGEENGEEGGEDHEAAVERECTGGGVGLGEAGENVAERCQKSPGEDGKDGMDEEDSGVGGDEEGSRRHFGMGRRTRGRAGTSGGRGGK